MLLYAPFCRSGQLFLSQPKLTSNFARLCQLWVAKIKSGFFVRGTMSVLALLTDLLATPEVFAEVRSFNFRLLRGSLPCRCWYAFGVSVWRLFARSIALMASLASAVALTERLLNLLSLPCAYD